MVTNKAILLIFYCSIVLLSAKAQHIKPINGGVYVSEELISNRDIERDSICPILALRIDTILQKQILVKYRFGHELIMDADFEFSIPQKHYILS